MTTACLAGSTGLVGSNILTTLKGHSSFNKIYAFTRKDLPSDPKLTTISSTDSSTWPSLYPKDASIFFSGLGTTRAIAGGLENQRKIDHDLNLALAKAAKDAGATTYVLISGNGANSNSFFPYIKLKGDLEDAVKALDFEHCVILQPGLIVGDRVATDSRPPEYAFRKTANLMGALSPRLKDFWAQDATVIARAAVAAVLQHAEGKAAQKVRIVGQAEIIKLGRTEWTS